jgi:hypothetical protein
MSAIASMTLADGQATPANHTFAPVGIDQASVAKWADRSGGIALGFPAVSFSLRSPSKTSRNFRLTAKVVTPVLEVTSPSTSTGIQPAPTLAYNLVANVDIVLPERSTVAQRKDLIAFLKNYLATTTIQNAVENFEQVY